MLATIVTQSTSAAQFWFLVAVIIFILTALVGVFSRAGDYVWANWVVVALGFAAISLGLLFLA